MLRVDDNTLVVSVGTSSTKFFASQVQNQNVFFRILQQEQRSKAIDMRRYLDTGSVEDNIT
jgi:hypothetical protein